jgi:hypothetical protein
MLFRQTLIGYTKANGSYIKGRWQEGIETEFSFSSSVQPLKGSQLESLPEGRRNSKSYNLFTDKLMNCLLDEKNPDIVIIFNERYEVFKREKWQNRIVPHYYYIVIKIDPKEIIVPDVLIVDFEKTEPEEDVIILDPLILDVDFEKIEPEENIIYLDEMIFT